MIKAIESPDLVPLSVFSTAFHSMRNSAVTLVIAIFPRFTIVHLNTSLGNSSVHLIGPLPCTNDVFETDNAGFPIIWGGPIIWSNLSGLSSRKLAGRSLSSQRKLIVSSRIRSSRVRGKDAPSLSCGGDLGRVHHKMPATSRTTPSELSATGPFGSGSPGQDPMPVSPVPMATRTRPNMIPSWTAVVGILGVSVRYRPSVA